MCPLLLTRFHVISAMATTLTHGLLVEHEVTLSTTTKERPVLFCTHMAGQLLTAVLLQD